MQRKNSQMKLIADLLRMQDPDKPHTLVTRVIVSLIIVGINLVYAGFFGVLGAVAVYLLFVELVGVTLQWALAPVGLALIVAMKNSFDGLADYWRNFGHGQV